MHHIVYHTVIRTIKTGKIRHYIGKHSTKNLNDGYVGSGKRISRIVRIEKEISNTYSLTKTHTEFETEDLAFEFEELAISEAKDKYGKSCINIAVGGRGGWRGVKHTSETRKLLSEKSSGKNNGMYGRHHTKEMKEKMSVQCRERQLGIKYSAERLKSYRKSPIWEFYDEIYPLWISIGRKSSYFLRKKVVPLGYPDYEYKRMIDQFIKDEAKK